MKRKLTFVFATIALAAISSTVGAQDRQNRSISTNGKDDRAITDCGDIRVNYDRRPSITENSEMTLPASQVSTLRVQMTHGGTFINGWDRSEYSVKTCKAVPDNPDASSTLREITTTFGNSQVAVSGPSGREWTASFILMVPRLSNMNVETSNGPLQVRDLAGVIRLNAKNGPIGLRNVGGVVETTASNGPISLAGGSGDQRVQAANGPISVALAGSRWDGPGIEVTTKNGPLTLSVPDGYISGIQIRTSRDAPVNCRAAVCAGATRSLNSQGLIRLGNGDPVVRLSTENGPLSIQGAKD